MKNKFRIIVGVFAVLLMATSMAGCSNGGSQNTDTTKEETSVTDEVATEEATTEEVATEEASVIDEATAKEVVFADLCIQESAAQDLTVKLENNAYVIAFVWSGFDYQYTVDATTGEIIETIFDGEVL